MTHKLKPRLGVEALELRDCPAVFLSVVGNTLVALGDNGNNTVTITDDGRGGVSATGDGRTVSGTGISNILVSTQAGADTFSYALTGALAGNRLLAVDLGRGDDTGSLNLAAGVASGNLLAELQGNDGVDRVGATVGGLAAGARAAVEVNGGKGNDIIDNVFSGELDGALALKGSGQDGEDTVTQNVSLAAGSTGLLATSVRGGKGNDRLTLNVTGTTSALRFFEAKLDGDDGIDTFTATANVRVRNAEVRA